MTDTEIQVLNAIERHTKANPVTGNALGEMFGITERKVQAIVRKLRLNGRKVAASMAEPMGYYLAQSPEEMIDTAEALRVRGREYFHLANRLLDFGSANETLFEQKIEAA